MTPRVLAIAAVFAASSVAATWLLLNRSGTSRHVAASNSGIEPAPTADRDSSAAGQRTPSGATVAVAAATSAPVVRATHEDGESSLTLQWKELVPAERLRVLEDDFEAAVGSLEEPRLEKRERTDAQRIAETALSAMRAELYDSERGRALHQAYEARLDRAVAAGARGRE